MFVATAILSGVLALAYLGAGSRKIIGGTGVTNEAKHLGFPYLAYRLIGVLELAAVAGLLIGLAWAPLGIAAAGGLVLLMIGAATAHRRVGDPLVRMVPAMALGAIAVATVIVRVLSA
jgi:uncharacterized membrane protein YphA (DoxX/SURF4 family)